MDGETGEGFVRLMADSNGRKIAKNDLISYLSFLNQGEYRETVNWFYNLQYDTNSMLKYLDRSQREEVITANQIQIEGFMISIIPNKELKISKIKKDEYNKDGSQKIHHSTFFYDLAQFYDFKRLKDLAKLVNMEKVEVEDIQNIDWDKYQTDFIYQKLINDRCIIDCQITKALADKLTIPINELVVINKYKSKASIARKYVLENLKKRLTLPDYGILQASLDSYHAGHIEIAKMGLFKSVYNTDLNCFSEDTELLTIEGFKKWNELTLTDHAATLNLDNGNIEYQQILHIHRHQHNGDLLHQKTENLDIMVTPNHRIYYQSHIRGMNQKEYGGYTDYKVSMFKDVPNGNIRIPTNGKHPKGIKPDITKEMIKLCAWIITEGHFKKDSKGINIYQSNKYNYQENIRNILQQCGILFYERNRGTRDKQNYDSYEFYIKGVYGKFIRDILGNKKEIPKEWVLKWDKEYLAILFWELMKGDGSFRCQRGKADFKSYNDHDLDMMNLLALKIGYKSSINHKNHTLHIKLNRDSSFAITQTTQRKIKVPYKGIVWCVTVPNDTIVVRRNGKIFITGNSAYPAAIASLYETEGAYLRNRNYEPDASYSYYNVIVDYDNPYLSPLWFNKGGNNYHVTGKFETWITKSEYELLYKKGIDLIIKKAHHIIKTSYTIKPFENIIHDLYKRRLEAKTDNDPIEKVIKVILNSIYGVTINTVLKFDETEEDTDIWIVNAYNEIINYKKTFKATNMYNPLFGCDTTAKTRVKIFNDFWDHLKNINAISTDGIYLSKKPRHIKVNKELGNYSVEKIPKYLLLGSGRYFVLNPDDTVNNDKSRFRSISMKPDKMFGIMDVNRNQKNVKIPKTKVIKLKESNRGNKYFSRTFSSFPIQQYNEIDLFNTFQTVTKKVNFFESRRVWDNKFETIQDIFDIQLESRPYNVSELK